MPSPASPATSTVPETLVRYRLPGLVAFSAFATAALAVRLLRTGSVHFAFLEWNLVLAWIPYAISLGLATVSARRDVGWPVLLAAGTAWLAFFPNATYLVTDLVHLRPSGRVPHWYDVGLLSSFAFTGALLAAHSLSAMHDLVAARRGRLWGWAFAGACLALSGVGLFLGRFLRWNSWDLFVRPGQRLPELVPIVTAPAAHVGAWGFVGMFTAFAAGCYVTVRPR